MRTLLACLLLLVSSIAVARPTAMKVTFSNGSSLTATPSQAGDYRWSSQGATLVVEIQPATFKSVSQIAVTWSGGLSDKTGAAPGDGTAPVMMTIVDRFRAFDTVTVTPIP